MGDQIYIKLTFLQIVTGDACLNFGKLDEFSRILTERQISAADSNSMQKIIQQVHLKLEDKYGKKSLVHSSCDHESYKYIERVLEARKVGNSKLTPFLKPCKLYTFFPGSYIQNKWYYRRWMQLFVGETKYKVDTSRLFILWYTGEYTKVCYKQGFA